MSRIGALFQKFGAQGFDAMCRSPNPLGEALAAFHLGHGPRGAVSLNSTAEGGVTGWQEDPTGGDGLEHGVFVDHVAGFLTGTDFAGGVGHGRGDKGPRASSSRNLSRRDAIGNFSLRAGFGRGHSINMRL